METLGKIAAAAAERGARNVLAYDGISKLYVWDAALYCASDTAALAKTNVRPMLQVCCWIGRRLACGWRTATTRQCARPGELGGPPRGFFRPAMTSSPLVLRCRPRVTQAPRRTSTW